MTVRAANGGSVATIVTLAMTVALPCDVKGTHRRPRFPGSRACWTSTRGAGGKAAVRAAACHPEGAGAGHQTLPCSKKISDCGDHNQRSSINVSVDLRRDVAIEELVRIAEEEASCEVYGLLRRPDEVRDRARL